MMTGLCCMLGAVAVLLMTSLHSSVATLTLGLAEQDISVRESDERVELSILSMGRVADPVTLEVIPLTVSQYEAMGGQLPGSVSGDPATPDVDFNATVQRIQTTGQERMIHVSIDIVDDFISENREVFVVQLNVTDGEANLERSVTIVTIRQDNRDSFRTLLGFNTGSLEVEEGVGVVNDTVFIEVQGIAEPLLEIEVALSAADSGVTLLTTKVVVPSGASRVPVLIRIPDDSSHRGTAQVHLFLSQPVGFSQLYRLGLTSLILSVLDNDVATIGIEVSGSGSTLMEGDSAEVCVRSLGSSVLEAYIDLRIVVQTPTATTDTPHVSVDGGTEFYFYGPDLEHCVNVTADEDDDITPSWTLTFGVELVTYGPILNSDSSVVFEPQQVQLVILDNDGIPQTPANVQAHLINDKKDLLVEWDSTPTSLQPVQQYVINVQATPTTHPRVTKRQLNDDSMKKYITMETELVVQGIDPGMEYSVQVCAENRLGRTCQEPIRVFSGDLITESPTVSSASVGGVNVGGVNVGGVNVASLPVWVYAVAATGGVLLVCVVMVCLVGLCVCCGSRRSKHYYPGKQESKHVEVQEMEERYTVKRSSGNFSDPGGSNGHNLELSV